VQKSNTRAEPSLAKLDSALAVCDLCREWKSINRSLARSAAKITAHSKRRELLNCEHSAAAAAAAGVKPWQRERENYKPERQGGAIEFLVSLYSERAREIERASGQLDYPARFWWRGLIFINRQSQLRVMNRERAATKITQHGVVSFFLLMRNQLIGRRIMIARTAQNRTHEQSATTNVTTHNRFTLFAF
jgi:hypothetical protein